jgi:hypothetical protein
MDHGDDYCSASAPGDLDWMEELLKKKYEVKTQRIGTGKTGSGQDKMSEGQVLNRVVRRTDTGFELEADLRHAEPIVEQLGVGSCKPVLTPGTDATVVCAAWSKSKNTTSGTPFGCTKPMVPGLHGEKSLGLT